MAHETDNTTVLISLLEFEARLNYHDWFYAYSEMRTAYDKGKAEDDALKRIAEAGGVEYKALYNYAHQKMHQSPYWKPPYPEAWPF